MNIEELLDGSRDEGLPEDYRLILKDFLNGGYSPPVETFDGYVNLTKFTVPALLYLIGNLADEKPGAIKYRHGSRVYPGVAGLDILVRDVSRDLAGMFQLSDRKAADSKDVRFVRALSHLPLWKTVHYRHDHTEKLIRLEIDRNEHTDPKVGSPAALFHWSMTVCLGPDYRDHVNRDGLRDLLRRLKNEVVDGQNT